MEIESTHSSSSQDFCNKLNYDLKVYHDDCHQKCCITKCSSEKYINKFPKGFFCNLLCITNLCCTFCGIEQIDSLPVNLTYLCLLNNRLKTIDMDLIPKTLTFLDVSNNFIERIDISSTNIEKLSIASNSTKHIICNKKLLELVANNNKNIIINYNNNSSLNLLNLSNCNINSLANIPKCIIKLIVNNNSIESIDKGFYKLEYLNCTKNKIKSIDELQSSLQTLFISSNLLQSILIRSSSKLKHLSCSSNLINTLCVELRDYPMHITCYDNPIINLINFNTCVTIDR